MYTIVIKTHFVYFLKLIYSLREFHTHIQCFVIILSYPTFWYVLFFPLNFFPPTPPATKPLEKMILPPMATTKCHLIPGKEQSLMGNSPTHGRKSEVVIFAGIYIQLLCVHGCTAQVICEWQHFRKLLHIL